MSNSNVDSHPKEPARPSKHPGQAPTSTHPEGGCLDVPDLARLEYFHGQLLSAADLRTEQSYFREKLKLHNRCLHGHGVVCGLEVRAVEVCDPKRPGPNFIVSPGIALDCHGNEVILRRPQPLNLRSHLDATEYDRFLAGATVSLYVCFCEQPSCRAQSVLPEGCGTAPSPSYSRVRDSFRFDVRLDADRREEPEEPCDSCCHGGGCDCDGCVLLARVGPLSKGQSVDLVDVDNGVRRMLARYVPTRIDGVSWQHGARYSIAETREILGTDDAKGGIVIHFTRPVDVTTLTDGVIDIWVLEGGRGRSAGIWNMEGEYVGKRADGFVDRVTYRHTGGESLQRGDRVLITLRGAFVLDKCCRAVAGAHIGGKVPLLPDFAKRQRGGECHPRCKHPPQYPGSWTTGSELGGTTFESWIFVD